MDITAFKKAVNEDRDFAHEQILLLKESIAFKWFIEEVERDAHNIFQSFLINLTPDQQEKKFTALDCAKEKYRALLHISRRINTMEVQSASNITETEM